MTTESSMPEMASLEKSQTTQINDTVDDQETEIDKDKNNNDNNNNNPTNSNDNTIAGSQTETETQTQALSQGRESNVTIQALKKETSSQKRVSSKKDVLAILDPAPQRMARKSTIMITNEFRFFTDSWEMEDPIGQPGAFGIAYICHRKQYPATKYVVKQINKARFYHIDKKERDLILQNMSNEITLQKTLHHPNICLLYDVYEDRNYIHLVMDYLEG